MRFSRKFIFVVMFLLILLSFPIFTHSDIQLSFLLDLDDARFNFTQNSLNDSSLSKELTFEEAGNITVWISLPKNSTVFFSNISLQGVMKPLQALGGFEILHDVYVLNINFSLPFDEIVIGTESDPTVKLLDYLGNQIWNKSMVGKVSAVGAGNLSSDQGNEIVAGDSEKFCVFNASGEEKGCKIVGEVYGLDVGEVKKSNEWDEIAVAVGTNIYLFNSSLNELWNYSASANCQGVSIGNLSTDEGNEVVGGCGQYIYIFNSSGSLKLQKDLGVIINDVSVGDVNDSLAFHEIAVATNNGTTFLLDRNGNVLWGFTGSGLATSVSVGEVTSEYNRSEVVIGSKNEDKVLVVNSAGGLIWDYKTLSDVTGVSIGNLSTAEGNEVAAVAAPADYTLYILNFEYYPTNPKLDIGNDNTTDWNYTGKFRGSSWVSNNSAFQSFLDSCQEDQQGKCDVPLVFYSDFPGILKVYSINISYEYDINNLVNYTIIDEWSRTNEVWVNESVGNQVKNITYLGNPAVDIQVDYIKISSSATACDFNGVSHEVVTVNGETACDISSLDYTIPSSGSLPEGKLWDSTMTTGKPVLMNESSGILEGGFWKKNLTIWNETQTVFTNIIANTTVDESSLVPNAATYLKVEWYNNGTFYNITPSTNKTSCSSPTDFESKIIGNDTFQVCMMDSNGNGIVETFVWKQPHTNKSFTRYEVSGSANYLPQLEYNIIPKYGKWGSEFNISVNVSDVEGNNVTLILCLNLTHTFNLSQVNYSTLTWNCGWEKNTSTNATVVFNLTSEKSWTGYNLIKFKYRDLNESTGEIYHEWSWSDIGYGPNVTKHNVSITLMEGNNTQVNRTDSIIFKIQVNDTDLNNQAVENANCSFWIMLNDTSWDWGWKNVTDSSGYCTITFTPNASYFPGLRFWRGGVFNDMYYETNISENYTVKIYGKVNIRLFNLKNSTRNVNNLILAEMYDEFNQNVPIENYGCNWSINGSYVQSSLTNSSGYCNFTWTPDCSYELGIYSINVTLYNFSYQYFYPNITSEEKNTTLKEKVNIDIVSPTSDQFFHPGETIELNSSLHDSCGLLNYSYNVSWKLNCTTEEVYPSNQGPLGGTLPYYLQGDNVTWDVDCWPGALNITVNVTGDLYYYNETKMDVDVYGWSEVLIIEPSGEDYNRTEVNREINISCKVKDANSTKILDGYYVEIWEKFGNGNYTKLASGNTDNKGFFNYTWNISSNETVPEGEHTIRCNISDQRLSPLRFYNTSKPEDTHTIIILEVDTQPPNITWHRVTSALQGNPIIIEANVTDWYKVDKVWVNITHPNGSIFVYYLQNVTPYVRKTKWNISISDFTEIGDYDFVLYANDTSNWISSVTDWFEIYQPIQLYIDADYPIDFTFYRPGKDLIIHRFLNSPGYYNFTLHKRKYDFLAKLQDELGQYHSVLFRDFDTTATSIYQFNQTSNVTNPLNISNVSLSILPFPGPTRIKLAAMEIKENMVYSNVTVTFDYSKLLGQITYEPAISIYKCEVWENETCYSSWIKLTSSVDTKSHKVSTTQDSVSLYYALEAEICGNGICGAGESSLNCPEDCGPPAPEEGGGGEGVAGGGGVTSVCGNGICEPGENKDNCPQDCGIPTGMFSLRTNMSEAFLSPGESKGYALWITNLVNKPLSFEISLSGSILAFVKLEKNTLDLGELEEGIIGLTASVPEDAEPGIYTGEIVVRGDGGIERLPITLTISTKAAIELDVVVEVITKSVVLNETGRFRISLYNLGLRKRFTTNISYIITNLKTKKIVYQEFETRNLRASESYVKEIKIPSNFTVGKYSIAVIARYPGGESSSVDTFEVTKPFFTKENINRIIILTLAATLIFSIIYGRKKYIAWKLSKARYIFPVDIRKLPKGNLWLGKIAEMVLPATFDMNDLTTHVLIAGATGAGKSVTGNIFVEELLEKKIPVVVFDPTGQWTGFMRPCRDEKILKYYKKFGLSIRDTKSYPGLIFEVTSPKVEIDFKKFMNPGEITIFTLTKLKPGEYDEAVTRIIDSIFSQPWEESTELKLVIVFDEVHRLLEKYGGKGGYIALERACREFRKWGIGLIMISQVLSDFKEAIRGNVLTEVQMHTKSLGDLRRIETKYGLEYAKRVAREEIGVGMIQNPKYNEGVPWFISFRPPYHMPHKLPEKELRMYKEYSEEIEKIELEIERLEKEGKDVSDLRVELRLAKDKLKQGRFRMAEIYIASLKKALGLI